MKFKYALLFFCFFLTKQNFSLSIRNFKITVDTLRVLQCSGGTQLRSLYFFGKADPNTTIEFSADSITTISTKADALGNWKLTAVQTEITEIKLTNVIITSDPTEIFSIYVGTIPVPNQAAKFELNIINITGQLNLPELEKISFMGAYTAVNKSFSCPCPSDPESSVIKITKPETTIVHCIPPTIGQDDPKWEFTTDVLDANQYNLNMCIPKFIGLGECNFKKPEGRSLLIKIEKSAPPHCVRPQCLLSKAIINKYFTNKI